MEFKLVLDIYYDESIWTLETFDEDRKEIFLNLIEKFKAFNGCYFEGYEQVEFPNATPELEQLLRKDPELNKYNFDIYTKVSYSQKDIKEARFVPFLAGGDTIDFDNNNNYLNVYQEVQCKCCGRTNDSKQPTPFLAYYKWMEKRQKKFRANNGIRVFLLSAFELLRSEIEPWVDSGPVQIVDNEHKPVETDSEYIWIRPKVEVGPFVNESVKSKCDKCKQPTEVRLDVSHDTFKYNWLGVVKTFKNTKAPIVLAGTWAGAVMPQETSNHEHDVFISGELHEKIRKLKLKGFVEADYIIHSAEDMK